MPTIEKRHDFSIANNLRIMSNFNFLIKISPKTINKMSIIVNESDFEDVYLVKFSQTDSPLSK